jgi:hypothetical protein
MSATCKRCGAADESPQVCWYCGGDLCTRCWDGVNGIAGHCGHPEAVLINNQMRLATPEARHRLARALWPDSENMADMAAAKEELN